MNALRWSRGRSDVRAVLYSTQHCVGCVHAEAFRSVFSTLVSSSANDDERHHIKVRDLIKYLIHLTTVNENILCLPLELSPLSLFRVSFCYSEFTQKKKNSSLISLVAGAVSSRFEWNLRLYSFRRLSFVRMLQHNAAKINTQDREWEWGTTRARTAYT